MKKYIIKYANGSECPEIKDKFKDKQYPLPKELRYLYRNYRLTLDTEEDFKLIEELYNKFYKDGVVDLYEVMTYIDNNSYILDFNKNVKQKEY